MKIEFELWHLLSLLATVVGAFAAMSKIMLSQTQRSIDQKFTEISAHLRAQDETSRRVERDLMELKAELPRDYVRREDYTQAVASITIKIDAFSLRVEAMFLDLVRRGASS